MVDKKRIGWPAVVLILILLILAFNFLNFRAASSTTEFEHSFSTYRSGQNLPGSMAPGFTLNYVVEGEGQLAAELEAALAEALLAQTSVAAAVPSSAQDAPPSDPYLLVQIAPDRLWTPLYGRSAMSAQIFFASNGDAPWPLDEPVVFQDSPIIKADGHFELADTTWGILSKPAYQQLLAQALASDIAQALQRDVFTAPPAG